MTDTIDDRLAKLQAKMKIPSRIYKSRFQARIETVKRKICSKCKERFKHSRDKFLIDRNLICGKCHEEIILKKRVDRELE